MQADLSARNPATRIRILGIGAVGFEDFNRIMTSGRTLPWLQDTVSDDVWGSWAATWRDVIILDTHNVRAHTYNLTSHDLANPMHYSELLGLLKSTANEP